MIAVTPEQQRDRREWLESLREKEGQPAGSRRYIGKCSRKGCRYVVAVDMPLVHKIDYHRVRLARVNAADFQDLARFCPDHGGSMRFKPVVGRESETECGPRCTSARGPNCECKCAGANHGASWLPAEAVSS